jgi:hypothetical protein
MTVLLSVKFYYSSLFQLSKLLFDLLNIKLVHELHSFHRRLKQHRKQSGDRKRWSSWLNAHTDRTWFIFQFLKVRRSDWTVWESTFLKPFEPHERKYITTIKFWEILHQAQLWLLLKTEKCVALLNSVRSGWVQIITWPPKQTLYCSGYFRTLHTPIHSKIK